MSRFDYSIAHVPGKLLYTADALSRAPTSAPDDNSKSMQKETEAIMKACISQLPASKMRLDIYSNAQRSDPDCQRVIDYCHRGWPDKKQLQASISPYWKMRSEFSMGGNLLLYRRRIVVPRSLQQETLKKIHAGHQGIQRCRLRAQSSVWWPGPEKREPLISSKLPDYPWMKVGSDLFTLNHSTYLLTVDYFSRWPKVVKLSSVTSK